MQPLHGRFLFSTTDAEREMAPGTLISVSGGTRHAVHCLEEGAFLLTLAWPGSSPAESAR